MPYVDSEDRPDLEPHSEREAVTPGELNFQFTCLADGYLAGNLNYQALNDVVGALEGAKLEVYRRLAAPYEDQKIEINGDVYETVVRPIGKLQDNGTVIAPSSQRGGNTTSVCER